MRYLASCTRWLLAVVVCTLSACSPKPLLVAEHREQQYVIQKDDAADTTIVALLRPYKRGVDTQMLVVIGHTDIPLTKAQPECTLGNFLADATLRAAQQINPKVMIAVGNYGSLRLPYVAPGPLTRGKLYELMPFDNTLSIVDIPGAVLQTFCNTMAGYKGWPVSGITFTIKGKLATEVLVGGAALNPSRVYPVAMNDYLVRGGDNCDFLSALPRRATGIFIRDAMIDYVAALERGGKPLHPTLQQRIRYAE